MQSEREKLGVEKTVKDTAAEAANLQKIGEVKVESVRKDIVMKLTAAAMMFFGSGVAVGRYSHNWLNNQEDKVARSSAASSSSAKNIPEAAPSSSVVVEENIEAGAPIYEDKNEKVGEDIKVKVSKLPALLDTDQALYDSLAALGAFIKPELVPKKQHMVAMYLDGDKDKLDPETGLMTLNWGVAESPLRLKKTTVVAIKVANPTMRKQLDFQGIKYRFRTFHEGIDYFYYACTDSNWNQAAIGFVDPNPEKKKYPTKNLAKKRYLKVIDIILGKC